MLAFFAVAGLSWPAPATAQPIVECVVNHGDGLYTAVFGYNNTTGAPVTIPIGTNNRFTPSPTDRGQPTTLQTGRSPSAQGALTVTFTVSSLAWTLGAQTATATPSSPSCATPPATPHAGNDLARTIPGSAVTIPVLANDGDPQGNALTVIRATGASYGTTTVNPNGTVTYVPNAGLEGLDSFEYTISDGQYGTDQGIVVVAVIDPANVQVPRASHSGTALLDGDLLLAGGRTASGATRSIEIICPLSHSSTVVPDALAQARSDHSAAELPGQRVFVVGGDQALVGTGELFDPVTETFSTLAATMEVPRAGHTATLLLDGRVLILGGKDAAGQALAEEESYDAMPDALSGLLYDPGAGTFTPLPNALLTARSNHTATLLPNGQILIVGGTDSTSDLASAEIFDPATGQSQTVAGGLATARSGHSAALWPDGRVVIAGGKSGGTYLSSVEVFDPATATFSPGPSGLQLARTEHTATLFSWGYILIVGGENGGGLLANAEWISPPPDMASPVVRASSPANGSVSVPLNAIVLVRLSEPVDVQTVQPTRVRLTGPAGDVSGTVGAAEGGLYITFVPDQALSPSTTYTLTLAAVSDLAANFVDPTSITFATAAVPAITSFNPGQGPEGTSVTLTGSGFDPNPARNLVTIGAVTAPVGQVGPTSLVVTVGTGAVIGAGRISLVTPGGQTQSSQDFTVDYAVPSAATLQPDQAPPGSPELTLTVFGDGFYPASVVRFAGVNLATTYESRTKLTAQVPAAQLASAGGFPVDVLNPSPGGGTSNSVTFIVGTGGGPVVAVEVAPVQAAMTQGESRSFFATAIRSDGTAEDVTASASWTSTNPAVATVSGGLVAAVSAGSATLTATFSGFDASASLQVAAVDPIPPDPATLAPPLDMTVATTIDQAAAFLYSGANPIQLGVATGAIDAVRAAVLRGVVRDPSGALSGVRITILGHPEFGRTSTRVDGAFDLAVNGGGALTVRYEKLGFLPADRQVDVPWQDYAWLPDIVMVQQDSQVSTIALESSVTQVAQGSSVTDAAGTRQAKLLFPPGTQAVVDYVDGSSQALSMIHVRATEYTVGAQGPQRMPAELPPTSGYTYAIELSADEAVWPDSRAVRFDRPVPTYTDNFLGFPVGGDVPVGYYDRGTGVWIASSDGRIIKILNITAGIATLDTDGDGSADDPAALEELGITDAERVSLASLYGAGRELWRFAVTHMTPWDCNWPYGPPDDAIGPEGQSKPKSPPEKEDDPTEDCGSVIQCETRGLGEAIAVTGTPFSLNYRSSRAFREAFELEIPLTGANPPASLKRVELAVVIAGQRFASTLGPGSGQGTTVTWNGRDAYGRSVQGSTPVTVRTGYVYDGVYRTPETFGQSFARIGSGRLEASRGRIEMTIRKEERLELGRFATSPQNLGGWTLSAQHVYDVRGRALLRGDGGRQSAAAWPAVIPTAAGNGTPGFAGDGGPAKQAEFQNPKGVAVGPDGSLYVGDTDNHRVRKVAPDGIVTTIAGTGACGFSGDEGPASQAELCAPGPLAVAPDGALLIADNGNGRIRRIDSAGVILTVAGNGPCDPEGGGCSGTPGTAATDLPLVSVTGLAAARDGTFYIADLGTLYAVGSDGLVDTNEEINGATGLGLESDGSLLIAERFAHRVQRLRPDGRVDTVAGIAFTSGFAGDGGVASQARLSSPTAVAVGPDGSFYIGDKGNSRIRRVFPEGRIITVAGNGLSGFAGESGPGPAARFGEIAAVAVGPDDAVYVADSANNRARAIAPALPAYPGLRLDSMLIADRDGVHVHSFNRYGQHQATYLALTGGLLYQLSYGVGGLTQVADDKGNLTQVVRDSLGKPTAIVAPGGQRTEFTLGAGGYLASVANPAGEATQVSHTNLGLLTSMTDPRGGLHTYTYNDDGLLVRDQDPVGGFKELAPSPSGGVTLTTAEGRSRGYQIDTLGTGDKNRTRTDAAGLLTQTSVRTDGTEATSDPDGTQTDLAFGPDPRWGMQSPLLRSTSLRTPGGLVATTQFSRSTILTNPTDPFSVQSVTDTWTINGRNWSETFTPSSGTLAITSPAGRQETRFLDAGGRVLRVEVPGLLPVEYQYGESGQLTAILQGTRSLAVQYDTKRRPGSFIDSMLRTTTLEYNDADRVTKQVLPGAREVLFGYDNQGNLTSVAPPGRPAHVFAYSPANVRSRNTPPSLGIEVQTDYSHNLDRQLTLVTTPDATISRAYDDAGRLSSVTTPEGTTTYTHSEIAGQLQSIVTAAGTLDYTYDGSLLTGRAWTGTVNGSVTRTFDQDLRVASERVNGADAVPLAYDADGLLVQAGALTITRNAQNGLITGTTLGNVTDSYTWNQYGEIERYTARFGATDLVDLRYTRDDLGRIIDKEETVDSVTRVFAYSYDDAGRLLRVSRDGDVIASYTYDGNGNRLTATGERGSFTGSYNDRDQVLNYAEATYTHNGTGELIMRTGADGTTAFTYDALGRLVGATLPSGTTLGFGLDGEGNRITKTMNGVAVQRWLYGDEQRLVAELGESGEVVTRYVYGTAATVPAYFVRGGRTFRIVADHLGSPRVVVDVTTGEVVHRLDYDEFGNITVFDSNSPFQPFGFTGREWDPETGLYYYRARYYDPQLGRFTSEDPIGFAGGNNFFAYVENNPVNWNDPSGLFQMDPQTAGRLAAGWGGALAEPSPAGEIVMTAVTVAVVAYEAYKIYSAEHGNRNVRQTEFEGLSDAEVDEIAEDDSDPAKQARAVTEQKARGKRNEQKRGKKKKKKKC